MLKQDKVIMMRINWETTFEKNRLLSENRAQSCSKTEEKVPSTPAAEDFSETKIHANISVSEKLVKFYWDKVIQRHGWNVYE